MSNTKEIEDKILSEISKIKSLKQLTSLDVNVKIGTSTTSIKIEW